MLNMWCDLPIANGFEWPFLLHTPFIEKSCCSAGRQDQSATMCQLMSCLFSWRPASLHSQHEAELFILQPEHLNICLAVIWLLVQEFASQLPQLGVILDYDSSSTSPEDAKAIQQLRSSGHVVTISSRTRGQHLASPAGYQPPHLVSPT